MNHHRSLTLALSSALLLGGASAASAAPTPTPQPKPTSLSVTGHGWGHGRGMGQWGALGYAVNQGWASGAILNHFYGGTSSKRVASPVVSVELRRYAGAPVTVTGRSLKVNGVAMRGAVRINRVGSHQIRVTRASSCAGTFSTWFTASSVTVVTTGGGTDPAAAVQVCEGSATRAFRGYLRFFDGGNSFRTVNHVYLESYLKGVVPRESPASWGNAGGGRGMEALKAQSVAARSYALASRRTYSKTCDTTACQVYGGWYRASDSGGKVLEDPRTSAAVNATRGLVRVSRGGSIARTEFSSSTGGFTAGGAFTAVRDQGDAMSANPNHNWSLSVPWSTVESRLGVGRVKSMKVTSRIRVGASPTRVTGVQVTRADGSTTVLSGSAVRQRLGLKSDWFSVAVKTV